MNVVPARMGTGQASPAPVGDRFVVCSLGALSTARPPRASLASMIGKVGDTIVVESERAHATGRRGVIEEVLQSQPPRYQVQWQDGHTSILSPAAGCARIEPMKRPRAKTKA